MSSKRLTKDLNFCLINDLSDSGHEEIINLIKENDIKNLFFYSSAIKQLKNEVERRKWKASSEHLSIEVYYCQKSADKFGILFEDSFQSSGLGQLVEMIAMSKKTLVIGAL